MAHTGPPICTKAFRCTQCGFFHTCTDVYGHADGCSNSEV